MKLKLSAVINFIVISTLFCSAQDRTLDSLSAQLQKETKDTARLSLYLNIASKTLDINPDIAISNATEAKELATKIGNQKSLALAFKYIGSGRWIQGNYIAALDNWNRAMKIFRQLNDREGIASIEGNIGSIFSNQGNDTKALEYFFDFLKDAEKSGNKFLIANAYNNIGAVYQHKAINYDKALNYYIKALPLYQELDNTDGVGTVTGNIGEIYLAGNNPDSAIHYFRKQEIAFEGTVDIAYSLYNIGRAYELREKYDTALKYQQRAFDSAMADNSKLYMVQSGKEIAAIQFKEQRLQAARSTFLKTEQLAREVQSSYDLKDIYAGLASIYAALHDYTKAFKYQSLLLDIKDSIYNKETDQKLARYEFDFEMEKKQGEITLLEKDKELQVLELRRQKLATYSFITGFGMILVLAFILYRNYRNKVKVNRMLDSQKAQIEQLLLNILPAEVASELQARGTATPRFYERVSVLFTDFKGFTKIADELSPQEVVSELNECFIEFDAIIEKYGLEKIKTIGDAYMCAGGIPTERDGHVSSMVRAAIEIQQWMILRNNRRMEQGIEPWTIRIGMHVGPLVAGVVGKKKYGYDIWGSTVNVASRMESNGEPGKVNISEAVYHSIRGEFTCTHRGKIYAKNIGAIDMYFVDHEILS